MGWGWRGCAHVRYLQLPVGTGFYGDYVLRDGLDYKEIGISPLWVGWGGGGGDVHMSDICNYL